MISDTKFFAVGRDVSGAASFIVMDVTTPSADWNKLMSWPDASCHFGESASVLSSDDTKIHALLNYGLSSAKPLIFLTLKTSDGSLDGNIYETNQSDCTRGITMKLNGDKIYMMGTWSLFHLIIYDGTDNSFKIFKSDAVSSHWKG